MVLHELATNAAKYGALSTPLGWVSVRWDLQTNGSGPAQLRLQWHENGGPLVTTPGRPSYGTSVIRELVPYELGGKVEIEYREKGVSCTIAFAIQSDGDRS
jgi:two-component sensor histidine kinase